MHCQKPIALFLFAHQDDEFGIFQKIIDETEEGKTVICAYFTDGSFGGVSSQRRNKESLAVLSKLGVQKENIFFVGSELSISDGFLAEYLKVDRSFLWKWLSSFNNLNAIYVPAWEGGHQDHDALHAITIAIVEELDIAAKIWQFSLYNKENCPGFLFKVFHSLEQNGPINATEISFQNRLRFLWYCLNYPSQIKTWLGLFPFVMIHYLVKGVQILQPVSKERIFQRPHAGDLLYEKRGFFTWKQMESLLVLLKPIPEEYNNKLKFN